MWMELFLFVCFVFIGKTFKSLKVALPKGDTCILYQSENCVFVYKKMCLTQSYVPYLCW